MAGGHVQDGSERQALLSPGEDIEEGDFKPTTPGFFQKLFAPGSMWCPKPRFVGRAMQLQRPAMGMGWAWVVDDESTLTFPHDLTTSAGILTSVFTLCAMSLGVGVFVLPQVFMEMGLIAGIVSILFFAYWSYWLQIVLVRCAKGAIFSLCLAGEGGHIQGGCPKSSCNPY